MPDQNGNTTGPEESQVQVTDEVLAKKVEELDEIRAELQKVRDERVRAEANSANAVAAAQLDAEKERLLAELATEKALTERAVSASDGSLADTEAQMEAAVTVQEKAPVPSAPPVPAADNKTKEK